MEEEHRQVLRRNLEKLVDGTHLDPMLSKLLDYGVFSEKMIEKYQVNAPVSERIRDLYMDIQRRGPQAFDKLHEALVATRHFDLAKLIKPEATIQETNTSETNGSGESGSVRHSTVPITLPQYMSEESQLNIYNLAVENPDSLINIRECPISVQVKQASQWAKPNSLVPAYKMTSRPKGYALIINNRTFICNENERYGSEHDSTNLKDLFLGLGFDVTVKSDLPYEEMKKIIDDFSKRDFTIVDSCIVSIMSHGIRTMDTTNILGTDGASVPTEWVIEKFSNKSCPSLIGKPKIFIFQTCRGIKEQGTVNVNLRSEMNREYQPLPTFSHPRTAQDSSEGYKTREHADILIAHSTLPGYKSNRDIYLGTWFIQSICEVFMENAWNTDIEDMLKMVDCKVAKYIGNQNFRQTSMYENRGFLTLYFNPGLYKE